jgi:hypothetical protein
LRIRFLPHPLTAIFAVLVALFRAMTERRELYVHASVDPVLVSNLREYQDIWHCWSDHFAPVPIHFDHAYGEKSILTSSAAVQAISGGVDSLFTLLRNRGQLVLSAHFSINRIFMVHGFDIPSDAQKGFETARRSLEKATANAGLPITVVRTNIREAGLADDWPLAHGLAIGAILHLFNGANRVGLIAEDHSVRRMVLPWGLNAITNPMMASRYMMIVTDGGRFSRTEKVKHLHAAPEAVANLRVCWEGPTRLTVSLIDDGSIRICAAPPAPISPHTGIGLSAFL